MKPKAIRVTDCYKHYTIDQDKVCTPDETVRRFKERLKQVKLDILHDVKRIDNGRLDIPVYFSVCGKDAYNTIGNKKQMGKGSSPEQSRASACMELAERFSFFSFKKNPDNFIRETLSNLKKQGLPLLAPEKLLFSVHDDNTSPGLLEKLLANIPIQWVWATDLSRQEEVLVPFSWFFAINEFNGPSAGNTYEEAILQGISEIVERHVCAVVSHQELRTPAIDPDSVTDPVARELLDKFKRHNIDVYLNDFTLDTGIPTISALAIDRTTFPELSEIVWTAGTTPCPQKALIRALTEVAQLAGDFNTKANYVASGLPKPLSMDEVEYITNPDGVVALDSLPDLSHDNMKVEIERSLAALKKCGMEVLIVNTMHPDLQIPTIYTIVPGAHFRERSMIKNVGLFAAKLVAEQVEDRIESTRMLTELEGLLPGAYYVQFYLGRNLLLTGEFAEALAHFRKALSLRPEEEDLPYIFSYMGQCYKEMANYGEAIRVLHQGAALDDERPDIHNLLGFCHFKLEEYEKAISHFNRTVELNPSSGIDYANLGVNYRHLNRNDEAISHFRLALALDPTLDFARQHLAELTSGKAS